MRKSQEKIDNAVLKTLELLDNLPKEKARYGFYEKLNYRIEHPENELKAPVFTKIIRFAATPAMVAACIAFGIFIGFDIQQENAQSDIDVLMDTYGLSVSESTQLFNTESD